MSDVRQAIEFVLRQEDERMSGVVTNNRGDNGGRTRYGISERWHPDLTKPGFFDAMPNDAALTLADGMYANEYAAPLYLASIVSQAIATALLSMAVVEGKKEAVKLLQQAAQCPVDGVMGPNTVSVVNSQVAKPLMTKYANFQRAYFARLGANDPTQMRFVVGWGNRMNAVEALA